MIRHHECRRGKAGRLVDQHVRPLVIAVVGDEETGGVG